MKKGKKIIKEFCKILKIINKTSYDKYLQKFNVKFVADWHAKILARIKKSLKIIERKKLLCSDFIKEIKRFLEKNHNVLKEQKLAIVYWDAHFDNIIIKDKKIVGILDFERTEIASIDYVLNIIKRMTEHPQKYMASQFEKFAKKEDYKYLIDWFKEFYPELFNFKDLDERLNLYALEDDLHTLTNYPNSIELKQMIAQTIKYDKLRS
jgi:aminoglycoside phosphotransferase (APT) family kinase protein